MQDLVDQFNTKIAGINKAVLSRYNKKQFRKMDKVPEIVEMFWDIIQIRLDHEDDLDPDKVDWENFELLIFAWDVYFKEKTMQPNSKFKINDRYDLMNMAYVQKDDLYWTKDEREPYRSLKGNDWAKEYFFKEQNAV